MNRKLRNWIDLVPVLVRPCIVRCVCDVAEFPFELLEWLDECSPGISGPVQIVESCLNLWDRAQMPDTRNVLPSIHRSHCVEPVRVRSARAFHAGIVRLRVLRGEYARHKIDVLIAAHDVADAVTLEPRSYMVNEGFVECRLRASPCARRRPCVRYRVPRDLSPWRSCHQLLFVCSRCRSHREVRRTGSCGTPLETLLEPSHRAVEQAHVPRWVCRHHLHDEWIGHVLVCPAIVPNLVDGVSID